LVVSDDRTHKVTSAYMHVTCAFRKAGCPFILKLTKAKEGGWVLKGAKALAGTFSFLIYGTKLALSCFANHK